MNVSQFNNIIEKFFINKGKSIFISRKYKEKLIYIDKTNFRDLESIVNKSSEIICCEGAISHVSNVFNRLTIALVNYQGADTGIFWTKHMPNIKLIFRENIRKIWQKMDAGGLPDPPLQSSLCTGAYKGPNCSIMDPLRNLILRAYARKMRFRWRKTISDFFKALYVVDLVAAV